MRIRLQSLLPLAVGVLVAAGFVIVAVFVGSAVRDSLITVPGLTAERAAESAVRVVAVTGFGFTVLAVGVSVVLARMIAAPLGRMRAATERLPEEEADTEPHTPVAEIQDVGRGISRVALELRDQHEREVRERSELAALVEAVSEGIIQLDSEGRVRRVNRAGRALLGLPEDAVGHPIGALVREADLRAMLERAVDGQGTEPTEAAVDDRRLLVSVSPLSAGGAAATLVDLTELRRLEEVRRDFVANASHELKTPLTSIRGYTETLLGGGLPATEEEQFLRTIARNAERLQRVVDDLLDLSRIEAGRWQPELEPLDLLAVAENSWSSFAHRGAEQGVTFRARRETERRARADRRALEQVFSNLYDNALRYTEDGGTLRVTIRESRGVPEASDSEARPLAGLPERDPEKDWIVVEVQDTGAGIPRDALPRIFERFYRVDPARSRAEGGTGLGLSIVRHMLESMSGSVAAESQLGKGTTIRLLLPAAPDPA